MAALHRFAILLALAACAACAGTPGPTAMRTLSSLPSDPQRRSEALESSQARPGPENRPRTRKQQRVETTAATMAAIVGSWFSKSSNVVVGVGSAIDENELVAPTQRAPAGDRDDESNKAPTSTEHPDAGQLVPWVRLSPRDGDAPAAEQP